MKSVIVILMSTAFPAMSACSDGDWWPVEREAREARFVFVGTPIAEWPDPGVEGRGQWIAGTFYRLRVESVVDGAPIALVDLFSENSSGRFEMEIGVPYVVFASSCKDRLYAYAKGNSGALRESQQVLAQAIRIRTAR